MALINSKERYIEAVRELYPEGYFFKEQFEDKESDFFKLSEAQGESIYNFKTELNKLWLESRLETASEDTIADYERVFTGKINASLSLEERKVLINLKNKINLINKQIGDLNSFLYKKYKANILSIEEKIEPALFSRARFGQNRLYDYRAFSIMFVYLTIDSEDYRQELENYLQTLIIANKIIIFEYLER